MDGRLRVELADLRGWADQVGRAGGDCAYLADYVGSFVPDGDFGPILTPIRADYERLTGCVRDVLEREAGRLDDTGAALRHAAARYASTDARVAQDLGAGAAITDDGRAARRFHDIGPSTPPPPECGGEVLPVVTLGWSLDRANELLTRIGGPDIRSWVTDHIAGDIGKAAAQASVWEHASAALAAVRGNLSHGSDVVSRSWEGVAAESSRSCIAAWIGALESQSDTLALVAEHLRDVIVQAVDVAQVVTDTVKEIVAIVAAGWGLASIPIFGQAQLVERFRDVLRLAWDAKKVLAVFWYFLVVIKDCLVAAADCLTAESLPAAPRLPGRLA
jgi:uncharacterized protein YukE